MNVEQTIEFLLQNQAAHDAQIGKLIAAQQKNEKLLAEVIGGINSLARIPQAHEERISKLEDGQR